MAILLKQQRLKLTQMVLGLITGKFGLSSLDRAKEQATISQMPNQVRLTLYSVEISVSIQKNRLSETSSLIAELSQK